MQQKFHLILTVGLAASLLVACGSETDGNASVDEITISTDKIEVMDTSSKEVETENNSSSEEVTSEGTTTEAISETADKVEASIEVEEPEEIENPVDPVDPVDETSESIEPIEQIAIEHLVQATNIALEDYVFLFETTEEYVEITVHEQTDEDVTPLVGIYRYIRDTDEILISDYLTGEFVPYEEVE